jgi:hypothetical protein
MNYWLTRVFAGAFVRKIAYMLAVAFMVFVFHLVRAQTVCYQWTATGSGVGAPFTGTGSDPATACAGINGSYPGYHGDDTWSVTGSHPSSDNSGCLGRTEYVWAPAAVDNVNPSTTVASLSSMVVTCPMNNCLAAGKQTVLFSAAAVTGSTCGADQCNYSPLSPSTQLGPAIPGSSNNFMTKVSSQGTTCTGGTDQKGADSTPGVPTQTCQQSPAGVACLVDNGAASAPLTTATINNDVLNPLNIIPGTCASFSDGSSACELADGASALTDPPAPGASGVAATPAATFTSGGRTVGYFTAAQNASSVDPVVTTGAGSKTGGGVNNPSSVDAGSGSGDCLAGPECNDAASGGEDCTAPPSCSGDEVSCNALMQAWKARCPVVAENSASTLLGLLAADGSPSATWSSSVDVGSTVGLSDTGGPFATGSGTCPAPSNITIGGQTLSIDLFSQMCAFASAIQWVIIAIGWVVASRIAIGAIVRQGV